MVSRLRLVVAGLMLFSMMLAIPAFAQEVNATITGTVHDSTGDIVPEATVTVSNASLAVTRTAYTNPHGGFTVPELQPGTYTVKVSKDGYTTAVLNNVVTHVATITDLEFRLVEGKGTNESATAGHETGRMRNTDLSGRISSNQATELPTQERNFNNLVPLVAGVSPADPFDTHSKGFPATVPYSMGGAGTSDNRFSVDGANNNYYGTDNRILIYPSLDSIAEFKVLTQDYSPEYVAGEGGQITVLGKRGSSDFHGSLYYYGQNDALNAWNGLAKLAQPAACPSADPATNSLCGKNKLSHHDFGGSFGGPLKKDKIFFFVSEEWNREERGITHTGIAPTAAMQAGDFSALAPCPTAGTVVNGVTVGMPQAVNPATGLPVGALAGAQLSPAGVAFLRMYNTANVHLNDPCLTSASSAGFNFAETVSALQTWRQDNARADVNLDARNNLMLRFTQDSWVQPWQSTYNWSAAQPWTVAQTDWNQPSRMATARLTTTVGYGATNSLQFSWSSSSVDGTLAGENPAAVTQLQQAVPQFLPGKNPADLPSPSFLGEGNAGQVSVLSPYSSDEWLYTFRDDFTKVARSHIFTMGAYYSQNAKDLQAPNGNEMGQFGLPLGVTGAPAGAPVTTGNGFADLALAGEQFNWQEGFSRFLKQIRWRDIEVYGNDSWRMTPTVTINYGFRWLVLRPPTYANNQLSTFSSSLFLPSLGGSPCNGILLPAANSGACLAAGLAGGATANNNSLVLSSHKLITPRAGFAWDVHGHHKTVVRGGFGEFVDRDLAGVELFGGVDPPFNQSAVGQRTLDTAPATLGTGGRGPTRAFDTFRHLPNIWQAHLTVDRELYKNGRVRLSYTTTRGMHLLGVVDVNQIPSTLRTQAFAAGNNSTSLATLEGFRPFGVVTNAPILKSSHIGDSLYHSLQGSFETRFGKNTEITAAYAWSRNLTDVNQAMFNLQSVLTDNSQRQLDRGASDVTRTHVFTGSVVYSVPSLGEAGGLVHGILGGWQASTLITMATGAGLNVFQADPNAPLAGPSGTGSNGIGLLARPNRDFSQPCHVSGGNALQWINPAAYTLLPLNNGPQLPNAAPGSCFGPPIRNVDFSLARNWALSRFKGRLAREGMNLQFRMDVFNLMNHLQLSTPNTVLGTPNFGMALPAPYSNRELQYSVRLTF